MLRKSVASLDRHRLPSKLFGLVEPALPGEDSRPDASPDDLREEVVVEAEVLADLREPQRFVGAPLREERLGEVRGRRRSERLVAHLLEHDVSRAQTLLGRGQVAREHLHDSVDVRGR